jgi:hypothetical protein
MDTPISFATLLCNKPRWSNNDLNCLPDIFLIPPFTGLLIYLLLQSNLINLKNWIAFCSNCLYNVFIGAIDRLLGF